MGSGSPGRDHADFVSGSSEAETLGGRGETPSVMTDSNSSKGVAGVPYASATIG